MDSAAWGLECQWEGSSEAAGFTAGQVAFTASPLMFKVTHVWQVHTANVLKGSCVETGLSVKIAQRKFSSGTGLTAHRDVPLLFPQCLAWS